MRKKKNEKLALGMSAEFEQQHGENLLTIAGIIVAINQRANQIRIFPEGCTLPLKSLKAGKLKIGSEVEITEGEGELETTKPAVVVQISDGIAKAVLVEQIHTLPVREAEEIAVNQEVSEAGGDNQTAGGDDPGANS